ncbi:PQQ-dependent sugar dehydrogenase [Gammaproteobacteria bacterium]|nr:PQQ-dependent sugar dehydrogenase [Gammaproteobacteria bacterium]
MHHSKIFIASFLLFTSTQKIFSIDLNQLNLDPGFEISIFAKNLDSPRQMAEGKNGTIFVGERGGQIIALIDSDNNGQADSKIILASNLMYSTGISIFNRDLYFSEISKIWKIENIEDWISNYNVDSGLPEKILVFDNLPNDQSHGWKWLKHDQNGDLYFNIGAPCNICMSENPQYASILKLTDGELKYVARGVRNSVGFDFHPISKKLFFTDNGRDWLGDDSPSCELNRVDFDGQFFGYPFKHASMVNDPEFGHINPGYDFVDPILELGAHVAPTGISFYNSEMFPEEMKNNLFIVLHGSWNRTEKVGYKVIRVEIDINGNVKSANDFITGWLNNGKVSGRPSAPFVKSDGSLLVSDDKANVIYQVKYQSS